MYLNSYEKNHNFFDTAKDYIGAFNSQICSGATKVSLTNDKTIKLY